MCESYFIIKQLKYGCVIIFFMEESKAIIGILFIAAISLTAYFVITDGLSGAAVSENYQSCCCHILAEEGFAKQKQQAIFTSQIQTRAENCREACQYYAGQGNVFAQEGLCAE